MMSEGFFLGDTAPVMRNQNVGSTDSQALRSVWALLCVSSKEIVAT